MGEAIVEGVLAKGVTERRQIWASDLDSQRRTLLKTKFEIKTTASNREALKQGDVVVLAVKPQTLPKVMAELEGLLGTEQTVLSIVAGASMATLSRGLKHRAIVRAMPNTAARIGEGMTVWTATKEVNAVQREWAKSILEALGQAVYVDDEKYLDMATAVSASGPAYVFLFIESLIDAGVHIGLPRDISYKLVLQTVLGSTLLVQKLGAHPAELRNMVTSPGGTTAEALLALEETGFRASVVQAVIAAFEKAKALGEEK
ncbi:MAG: pyrroline-5-carboxylate reductase [Chloroflexi bacterium]|nr:pyrroline-5-carboxylate reductase [Chloroflexota bacterium]